VPEYWVVEVDARRLHVFRDPLIAEGRYASVQALDAPFTIAPCALPQVRLRDDEIWR
jgi:Uma2 family endonuclease